MHMLSWLKAVQTDWLETFEHFKARVSLHLLHLLLLLLLLSPQSGKMSLYPKWAGAVPAGDPRGENPVLKSSDRPGSRGTDRRKDNNRFKNRSLQHKYCSSKNTFLFRWGQFCNFLLAIKNCKNLCRTTGFNLCPAGGAVVAGGLIIHSHSGQTWGQCGGRALYTQPPFPHMHLNDSPGAFCILMTIFYSAVDLPALSDGDEVENCDLL